MEKIDWDQIDPVNLWKSFRIWSPPSETIYSRGCIAETQVIKQALNSSGNILFLGVEISISSFFSVKNQVEIDETG